ncbi:NAD-P-binding protein [Trametes polyzona]|nr:NAD-P-binding protein [Trametes polyzona]
MSATKTNILITGATGYIGGTVLERLLKHPKASTFEISTLVRSAEKAKVLKEQFGVNAVVGTHADFNKLAALAENADVVLSCADSDDLPAMEAIFKGIKSRFQKTGVKPILIHTSGTGLITDEAKGLYATDKIWHDSRPEEIESLPDDAFHRNVDLPIVNADKEGWVLGYVVLPSTIYGLATGRLFDTGLFNRRSAQIPLLIKLSIARGQAGMVGQGKPIWNSVHIDDNADFYLILFDAALEKREKIPHGREGFYYLENGEHTWYDLCKTIAKELHAKGASKTDEPTTFTDEELTRAVGNLAAANLALGSNSRARGEQARALGWKPKYTTADLFASIKAEVELSLKA